MSREITIKEFTYAFFSSLPDGNYVLLSKNGQISEAIHAKTNRLGINCESIGKSFRNLLPESLTTLEETFPQIVSSGNSLEKRYPFPKFQLIVKLAPCAIPSQSEKFILFSAIEMDEETDGYLSEEERSVIQYEENLHKEIIKIFNWRHEIEG